MVDLNDLLRNAMNGQQVFDSCKKEGKKDCEEDEQKVMDDASDFAKRDIAMKAAATIQQWLETEDDDLEEGETLADRLLAMFVGIADANKDGEITDDEADVIEAALEAGYSYLTSKGVTPEDASSLLNDWDEETAERVKDFVSEELPDGEEAEEDIDKFAFSEADQDGLFDSVAIFDATYKKTFAIRNGKKVRINKRISGTVRLSAKQKMAIRKARMKSHSASAMMKRMKSMRLRARSGLKNLKH